MHMELCEPSTEKFNTQKIAFTATINCKQKNDSSEKNVNASEFFFKITWSKTHTQH